LASPTQLGKFWIFMYRVSPFTYLVSAVLSTGLSGSKAVCSDIELLKLDPPSGQNCGSYLNQYAVDYGAHLQNPNATEGCEICSIQTTDQFLEALSIYFDDHWRNVGLLFVYIVVNIFGALLLYWLIRVPKKWSRKVKEQ
jgi:ABC-type multidrug transport system permease subunit